MNISINHINIKPVSWLLGVLVGFSSLTGCTEEDITSRKLAIRLTDAPGNYDAVNIDIQDVLVHTLPDADKDDGGWTSLSDVNRGVYNLLDLRNGNDTLLASEADLPFGNISQIRLVLGEDNSVVVDGKSFPLKTPSAQQSGLKLKIDADLVPGVPYNILLDFDAAQSVVQAGKSGKYNLKPTIRTIIESQSGAICGQINTSGEIPTVLAISRSDTLGAIPSADGKFLIQGARPDAYTIVFKTSETEMKKERVIVHLGQTTDLGIIDLQ